MKKLSIVSAPVSGPAIRWIEEESKTLNTRIHHSRCGQGGERIIAGAPVDGYDPSTKTVYQYHGCHWHGCPQHCEYAKATEIYSKTLPREEQIKRAGYKLVVMWECKQSKRLTRSPFPPKPVNKLYPHEIIYDFEALLVKTSFYTTPKTYPMITSTFRYRSRL